MSEQHIYPYQCEGDDCPLCYLDAEIERLCDIIEVHMGCIKVLTARNERLEAVAEAAERVRTLNVSASSYIRLDNALAALKEQTDD